MRHPQFRAISELFQWACGYCGVTEVTVGGELTLDHYCPRVAGGGDRQDNLVYACVRCNQYKGDFWPLDADLAQGRRVLHPHVDDLSMHIVEDEKTGYLRELTVTGAFHIALLRLNRPQLVAHRLARRLQRVIEEKIDLLQQQNADLEKTISAQERYLRLLGGQSPERK